MSQPQMDAWRQTLGDLNLTKHHPQPKHDNCKSRRRSPYTRLREASRRQNDYLQGETGQEMEDG